MTGILNVRMATKTDGVAENRPHDRQRSGSDPKPPTDVANAVITDKGTYDKSVCTIVVRRHG